MKWLYRIFRLFKCPHHWVQKTGYKSWYDHDRWPDSWDFVGVFQCSRCGKVKEQRWARGKMYLDKTEIEDQHTNEET